METDEQSFRTDRSSSSFSRRASGTSQPSNVLVAVRVRPLLLKEEEAGHAKIVKVIGDKLVLLLDRKRAADTTNLRSRKPKEKRFVFDHAFSPEASQETLFSVTTSPVINSVLDGFNGTVFAYGATGSGKTYTMTGTSSEPGLMFLTLRDLFEKSTLAGKRGIQYKVRLSYLEIYNENIRDLMKNCKGFLELREHPVTGMRVSGITEYEVKNVEEIMELLILGNENRTTEPTEANDQSSRSHAVLQVLMEQHDASNSQIKTAKLNLIDLAGSERGAVTQNRGARLLEGANINRSLLALGNCINALAEKSKIGSFVPYRDSKLTRLLKDSLGGNCNTVMITTVSPSHTSIEESSNTLKYASRAKKIKNYAICNEKTVSYHVSKYEKVIADLQQQVSILREQLDSSERGDFQTVASSATEEERAEYEELKMRLSENFAERTSIRKDLREIHELQLAHFLTISNTQTEADEAKLRGASSGATEASADATVEKSAKRIRRNEKLRVALNKKLETLASQSSEFTAELKGLTNSDLRGLLSEEMNGMNLELENLELESKKFLQERLAENKDAQLRRLQLHIRLRDAVIHHQKEVLTQNGVVASSLRSTYGLLSELEDTPQLSSEPQADMHEQLTDGVLPPLPLKATHHNNARGHSRTHAQPVSLPEVKHVPRQAAPTQNPNNLALLSASIQNRAHKQQMKNHITDKGREQKPRPGRVHSDPERKPAKQVYTARSAGRTAAVCQPLYP